MRKIKSFLAVLLALVMVITIAPVNRASADGTDSLTSLPAPATEKKLIDNGDGTYTLALSVTGKTDTSSEDIVPPKSNVVLVIDVSGSMSAPVGTLYTYSSSTYRSSNYYYGYNAGGDIFRVYHRNNAWRTSDSNYGTQYSGSVYLCDSANPDSRMEATQAAANDLIDALLANNKDKDGFRDIMEISLIKFANKNASGNYNGTSVLVSKSTNATTLKNQINSLSESGGTNWEAAFQAAKNEGAVLKGSSDEAVSVIFLTDGVPTYYGSDEGYVTYDRWGRVDDNYAGQEQDDNIHLCWNEAKDDARAIITAGYELFNIFAFGQTSGSNYLKAMTNYAYTTGNGTYTNYNDQTYTAYKDGTKKTSDFFYDATDTEALVEAFKKIIEQINSGIGYVGVELKDEVTSMTSANVSASAGGSVSNCKYYRSGGSYSTTANNGLGEEWTDAPKAVINSEGKVDWDLGDDFQLENGVTYTITFVVWPSQASLDLVADLNNGLVEYDSLTEAQKQSIIKSGNTYTLKTNTDFPTVTYQTKTTKTKPDGSTETITSDPITNDIKNPDPVGLLTDKLTVEKKWEDTLDPSQREEVEGQVVLDLYEDGVKYVGPITLNEANNWKLEDFLSIAPGMLITQDSPAYRDDLTQVSYNGTTYYILETGHDYKFQEDDINSHFELTAYEYHPMIIGSEVKDVTFTYDDEGNITGISDIADITTISATNTLKGGINLTKKVVDEDGNEVDSNDVFTVTMNLQNPDGSAYAYDYRIYYGEKNPAYASSGDSHRSEHIYGTGTAEVTLYVGDTVRFVNVDNGTLFKAEESPVGGYEMKSIEYKLGGAAYTDDDTVTADNETWYKVKGNTASDVTVTNTKSASFYVYHSSDNTVERIPLTDRRVDKDGKFNMVNETKAGYLYGGYYTEYALPAMSDDEIIVSAYAEKTGTTAYTYTTAGSKGLWMTDENGTAYEGDLTSWDMTKAYTKDVDATLGGGIGTEMTPKANVVYYLKEVPNVYLQPATYVVYDERDVVDGNMKVKKLYQMSATDDSNYLSVGFDVNTYKGVNDNGAHEADYYWGAQIDVTKDGAAYASLTAGDIVSGHTGLIAARDVTANYIVENAYYKQVPYHVTPDGIKVNAIKRMTIYLRNTRFNKNWKSPAMTKTTTSVKAAYSVTE